MLKDYILSEHPTYRTILNLFERDAYIKRHLELFLFIRKTEEKNNRVRVWLETRINRRLGGTTGSWFNCYFHRILIRDYFSDDEDIRYKSISEALAKMRDLHNKNLQNGYYLRCNKRDTNRHN